MSNYLCLFFHIMLILGKSFRVRERRSIDELIPSEEKLALMKMLSLPSNSLITGENRDRIFSSSDVYVTCSTFADCFAFGGSFSIQNGGAINIKQGKLYAMQCFFTRNRALNGGSLAFADVELVLYENKFVDDSARMHGGSLYVAQKNFTQASSFQIDTCHFYNCSSETDLGDGGAIYCENLEIYLNLVNFTDCTSNNNAGCIYLNRSSAQIFQTHFLGTISKRSQIYYENINGQPTGDIYLYIEDSCFGESQTTGINDIFINGDNMSFQLYASCFHSNINIAIDKRNAKLSFESLEENFFNVTNPDQQRQICDMFHKLPKPSIPPPTITPNPSTNNSTFSYTSSLESTTFNIITTTNSNNHNISSSANVPNTTTEKGVDGSNNGDENKNKQNKKMVTIIISISLVVIILLAAVITLIILLKKRKNNRLEKSINEIEDVMLHNPEIGDYHEPAKSAETFV